MIGHAVIQYQQGSQWLNFDNPLEIVQATKVDDVIDKIQFIESRVNEQGLYAAGFICYESAPAFDQVLEVREPGGPPLLWFGLYNKPTEIFPQKGRESYQLGPWLPSISNEYHSSTVAKIRREIALGNTYQVNFTFQQKATFEGDPWDLFVDLNRAQQADYGAYIDAGQYVVCSASPELFFSLDNLVLESKPMKGTVDRGRTLDEDIRKADWLRNSSKNQAENVMIVDMIRNDLGRISRIGSVEVSKLFELERYPTLWQMTSTIVSESDASFGEIISALFPCASITGAPKVSTMKIIASMESGPRGVYTGCIGLIAPDRQAQFNVAIRTVVVDKKEGAAHYGVGGGIVWDSSGDEEYQECLTKSLILTKRLPDFQILESILWNPDSGYFLLEEHLNRLAETAAYFGYQASISQIKQELVAASESFPESPQKVRLLLYKEGQSTIESTTIDQSNIGRSLEVGLANEPVNSRDIFLFHKTTHRRVYEQALLNNEEWEDVILWNEHGEITESTTANVVVKIKDRMVTPPLMSGLLAGTFRAHLLESGQIKEETVTIGDLRSSQEIHLVNSVQKWREATLASSSKSTSELFWPQ